MTAQYKIQLPSETMTYSNLEAGYKAMAMDEEYEKEAKEWVNGYFWDTWDD
ncbi:MAG: hypothetical protein LBC85_04400 [Fibromonadaceae bacterium]|jgi:hypothetical protein|nr:hypothetical protein [Fibromonadaceae bacterium]